MIVEILVVLTLVVIVGILVRNKTKKNILTSQDGRENNGGNVGGGSGDKVIEDTEKQHNDPVKVKSKIEDI